MEVRVKLGSIAEFKSDAVIAGLFEGTESLGGDIAAVDKALGGVVGDLISRGEIKGKLNEVTVIHSLGRLPASRVAVVGLGKREELSRDKICGVVAGACRSLRHKGTEIIAVTALGAGVAGIDGQAAAQAVTEGALLGLYTFRKYLTKENDYSEIKELNIMASRPNELEGLEAGVERGRIMAETTNFTRDMVNEPANHMTPSVMADRALEIAEKWGLEISILEREDMVVLGMGGILGVAQGSREAPKMIVLRYRGGTSGEADLALVGKGLTFDSGGISIKPANKMEEMKGDMSGGAAVIAAMGAIAQLKPALNILAVVPATENLPDGSALKPGDVVKIMSGKTVEIISTDAEGRLILADAISYVRKLGAKRIIDAATLTGACMVALGDVCSGAFANNQELVDMVIKAGAETGELIWQMPMYEQYKEQNKSEIADIKNVGGRYGGAITAAQFLAEFIGDTPWVHLDIAGTFLSEKERGCLVKGATGVPASALVRLVEFLAKE